MVILVSLIHNYFIADQRRDLPIKELNQNEEDVDLVINYCEEVIFVLLSKELIVDKIKQARHSRVLEDFKIAKRSSYGFLEFLSFKRTNRFLFYLVRILQAKNEQNCA